MNSSVYVDTSAFAKWYLNEARSDDVEGFIRARRFIAISRLTTIELRCLLARRRRNKEIDRRTERGVLETFEGDVRQGFVTVHPLEDRHAVAAYGLLTHLTRHPLRTLDALHLAIAVESGARILATADAVMAAAAMALGMAVERFDSRRKSLDRPAARSKPFRTSSRNATISSAFRIASDSP